MEAIQITADNIQSYEDYVAKNSHSFLQSSSWGSWQRHLGRESWSYFVLDNTSTPVLSAQFIKHRLPLNNYYLYCPFGPVTSKQLAVSIERFAKALESLFNQLKQDFPDCLLVKLEPQNTLPSLQPTTHSSLGQRVHPSESKTYNLQPSSRIQPGSTLLIDLNKTVEELLKEMHPKNRYNIRVAEKHQVSIKKIPLENKQELREVVELICNTTKRQGYKGHPRSYYEKFVDFFSNQPNSDSFQIQCYAGYLQEKILAGALFVDFGDTRDFLFGGSSSEHKEVMTSFLMQWQSMQDAKAKGLKVYDFGGTETSSGEIPGFVRFKLRFGGNQITYPEAVDVSWHNFQYKLFKLAKKVRF